MHRYINRVHSITTPALKLHHYAAEHEARHPLQDGQVGIAVIVGIAETFWKILSIQQIVDIQRQLHACHMISVNRNRVLHAQVQQKVGRLVWLVGVPANCWLTYWLERYFPSIWACTR